MLFLERIPFGTSKKSLSLARPPFIGRARRPGADPEAFDPRAGVAVGRLYSFPDYIPPGLFERIVVPCHRVVATTGLGGFAGGLPLKQRMLELEGALLPLGGARVPLAHAGSPAGS